jgi:hypothetical protein
VPASPERVRAVLVDVERYVEWWPQVVAVGYLGEQQGLVLCRSALPYTLELVLTRRVDREDRLEVEVQGDLEGTVAFDLAPARAGTRLDFAQDVTVRGALALASRVGRPLLTWNHDRMMRSCVEGLTLRLTAGPGANGGARG